MINPVTGFLILLLNLPLNFSQLGHLCSGETFLTYASQNAIISKQNAIHISSNRQTSMIIMQYFKTRRALSCWGPRSQWEMGAWIMWHGASAVKEEVKGEIGGDKGESIFITWQSIILRRREPQRTMELCRYSEFGWRNKCYSTMGLSVDNIYLLNTAIMPGLKLQTLSDSHPLLPVT